MYYISSKIIIKIITIIIIIKCDYYYYHHQWQRLFHSAYYDGMDALSKVTRYVRDVYEGLQPAGENAETQAQYSAAKREVDFEHLGDTASSSPVNGQSSLPERVRIIFKIFVHSRLNFPL